MHKILLAILLAGTAVTQANAAPTDRPDQQVKDTKAKQAHQGRAEGQSSKQTQPSGTDRRSQNKQTGQGNSRAQVTHSNAQSSGVDRRVPNKQEGQASSRAQAAHPNAQPRVKTQGTGQQHRTVQPRVQNRPHTQPADRTQNVEHTRPPVVSSVPRFGAQPPLRAQSRPTSRPQWNTSWRNNQRYDWNDYRRHHRSVYHQHSYHDPFGWGYQLFSIGWRLWPNYYSSNYWISDPWMYRLPPAPPGTRWIRYYNDALLVDMWSGEVVDVIHNFFW